MKVNRFTFMTFALLAIVACSKNDSEIAVVDENVTSDFQVIPLDDALKTLDSFIAEFESDNLITKSVASRTIASVETHYSDILTKSGEELPDAYIVNYENEEGFAVLGANTGVVPVVAYTEDGSFSTEDLENYYAELNNPTGTAEYDEEGNPIVGARSPSAVTGAIASSITNTNTKSNTAGSSSVAPLVKTKWRQGRWDEPNCFNWYCIHNGHYAWTGCSIIATAQVMAANKYYDPAFDYSQMDTAGYLWYYESSHFNQVDLTSQFIGFIFDHLKLTANRNKTGSTMAKIRSFLTQMDGYYNVCCSTQNSFTNAVVETARGMIYEGKPVIVSAAGNDITDKHCWILDGYKYVNGVLYFHCNWGYGGAFDGYYSSNWFCWGADNAIYDDEGSTQEAAEDVPGSVINQDYNWYVSMITYDHR